MTLETFAFIILFLCYFIVMIAVFILSVNYKSTKFRIIFLSMLFSCILVLPFPKYVDKTFDGYKIVRDKREKDSLGNVKGDVALDIISDVKIRINGWYFDFLIKDDVEKLVYTIEKDNDKTIICSNNNRLQITDFIYPFFGVYSAKTVYFDDEIKFLDVEFTKGFDSILLTDTHDDSAPTTSFIAPKSAYEEGPLLDLLQSTYFDGYLAGDIPKIY